MFSVISVYVGHYYGVWIVEQAYTSPTWLQLIDPKDWVSVRDSLDRTLIKSCAKLSEFLAWLNLYLLVIILINQTLLPYLSGPFF